MTRLMPLSVLTTWLFPLLLLAAEAPTVTAVGHATLKTRPDVMRAKLLLTADGKDVREAVAALAKRRDDVKQKLITAGATEPSVSFSDTALGNGATSAQQQRMAQIMMAVQRNRGGGSVSLSTATTQPQNVTVSCVATAEWPLATASADELLAAASDLEAKIKEAAKGTKKQMTPEEQEVAEEAAGMAAASGEDPSQTGPKADEPSFIFVHKVSDAEQAKLAADALARARAEGKRLANAAGATLGAIRTISSTVIAEQDESASPYMMYARMINVAGAGAATASDDASPEAIATQPGPVSYGVQVSVTFDLK
jgi:uncharacterized protein YggE